MLRADDRFLWRSWGARDGFTESYSYALSMDRAERLHPPRRGSLDESVRRLRVARIPDPRGNAQPTAVHQEGHAGPPVACGLPP